MGTTVLDLLSLERIEKNIYRGRVLDTTLQRTFGGQVAAQSLSAAVRTVERKFTVHSLHGYFLRPGNPTLPIVYEVQRIRDGRSFVTRLVNAIQDGEAIFSMSASFHSGAEGIEHADTMPAAPEPETLISADVSDDPQDIWRNQEWPNWDVRVVPQSQTRPLEGTAAHQQVWFRSREKLPDDSFFHICTLAYMSDMALLIAATVPHPDQEVQLASLDHAMWFLRPFRSDEWLLYDQGSPAAGSGRALTRGRIFDRQGTLVAYVVQEGLTRFPFGQVQHKSPFAQ